MTAQTWLWIFFNILTIALLAFDLLHSKKKQDPMSVREALIWSSMWIVLSLLFNGLIYWVRGTEDAMAFLTCYLVEKSLSVDNMFVFLMIFVHFAVPPKNQHKVLFFGILGAVLMRLVFIFAGVALVNQFHWVIYLFGAFLCLTGIKMLFSGGDDSVKPGDNFVVRQFHRFFPVADDYVGSKFFVVRQGRRYATPMLVVVLVVMTSDVMFAVDSIPAVLAISQDFFLVYTSNVLAVMGLRALYFVIAGMIHLFYYLQHGLSIILVFIGGKMILSHWWHFPIVMALLVVLSILALSMLASVVRMKWIKAKV